MREIQRGTQSRWARRGGPLFVLTLIGSGASEYGRPDCDVWTLNHGSTFVNDRQIILTLPYIQSSDPRLAHEVGANARMLFRLVIPKTNINVLTIYTSCPILSRSCSRRRHCRQLLWLI
jgi:hypothetical protein